MKIIKFLFLTVTAALLLGNRSPATLFTLQAFSVEFSTKLNSLYSTTINQLVEQIGGDSEDQDKVNQVEILLSSNYPSKSGEVDTVKDIYRREAIAQQLGIDTEKAEEASTIYLVYNYNKGLAELNPAEDSDAGRLIIRYQGILSTYENLFSKETRQYLHAYLQAVNPDNTRQKEYMLYAAALARDNSKVNFMLGELEEDVFTLRNALELPLQEDEPDWETLKFLVSFDRTEVKEIMGEFAAEALAAGDGERADKLIELKE